jgi:hypothetical protein
MHAARSRQRAYTNTSPIHLSHNIKQGDLLCVLPKTCLSSFGTDQVDLHAMPCRCSRHAGTNVALANCCASSSSAKYHKHAHTDITCTRTVKPVFNLEEGGDGIARPACGSWADPSQVQNPQSLPLLITNRCFSLKNLPMCPNPACP